MNLKRFDYSVRQKIGDPGSISVRNVFPLISVVPKPPQLQYGAKNKCLDKFFGYSVFSPMGPLLELFGPGRGGAP